MMFSRALLALAAISAWLIPLLSAEQVAIAGFVTDDAGLLPPEAKAEVEAVAQELYDRGAAQYAVVIVDSLEGRDIEGYAHELAEGRLGETGKNNGLLLLVASEDRRYRFEVGRSLEPPLPDSVVGRIGREHLVPAFREGRYGDGILAASQAVKAALLGQAEAAPSASRARTKTAIIVSAVALLVLAALLFWAIYAFSKKSASRPLQPKRRRPDDDYVMATTALGGILGRGGWGGGSGGFGGFGGGSFGGGGASGRW